MNIEEWKQFSDAVDRENRSLYVAFITEYHKECSRFIDDLRRWRRNRPKKENLSMWVLASDSWIKKMPKQKLPTAPRQLPKTLENFWEWKCGKLKLDV